MSSGYETVDRIRRSWRSAKPNPAVNPAWANAHMDVGILLTEIKQLRGTLSLAEEGLANYAQENERLKRLLNPRLWTREEDNAWHRAIPDLYKAFEALRGDVPQSGPIGAK